MDSQNEIIVSIIFIVHKITKIFIPFFNLPFGCPENIAHTCLNVLSVIGKNSIITVCKELSKEVDEYVEGKCLKTIFNNRYSLCCFIYTTTIKPY
jgi:hypothetical protein